MSGSFSHPEIVKYVQSKFGENVTFPLRWCVHSALDFPPDQVLCRHRKSPCIFIHTTPHVWIEVLITVQRIWSRDHDTRLLRDPAFLNLTSMRSLVWMLKTFLPEEAAIRADLQYWHDQPRIQQERQPYHSPPPPRVVKRGRSRSPRRDETRPLSTPRYSSQYDDADANSLTTQDPPYDRRRVDEGRRP